MTIVMVGVRCKCHYSTIKFFQSGFGGFQEGMALLPQLTLVNFRILKFLIIEKPTFIIFYHFIG